MSTSKEPHVIFLLHFFVLLNMLFLTSVVRWAVQDIWVLKDCLPVCKYTADCSQPVFTKNKSSDVLVCPTG